MKVRLAAAIAALAMSGAFSGAEAHMFGAGGAGLARGFIHPFSGLDHLLAMVAVGLWAAGIGGRALLALPVAFPVAMAVGAALGGHGVPLPGVETGVAASVVALGLLAATGLRPPLGVSIGLVGLFAFLHGHAHGAELPEAASPLAYGAGFIAATIVLHALGVGLGLALRRPGGVAAARLAGGGVALAGVALLAQLS